MWGGCATPLEVLGAEGSGESSSCSVGDRVCVSGVGSGLDGRVDGVGGVLVAGSDEGEDGADECGVGSGLG